MLTNNNESLKIELLSALKNEEFVLYYQPQFNLASGLFEGVEALIRWQHPTKGLLLPMEFISVAEESGLIVRIGEWVLRTACQQTKLWQEMGIPLLRIAVNISARQFKQKDFVELVMQIVKEANLKPQFLELELTENMTFPDDDEKMINAIRRLKKLGVLIALDDFGTGYSSISHLRKIPIDRIKIDKMYIQHIHSKAEDAAIVRAIIVLGQSLNLDVMAEGVETLEQLALLSSQECKEIQGFYFSEPLSSEEVEKFLLIHQNK